MRIAPPVARYAALLIVTTTAGSAAMLPAARARADPAPTSPVRGAPAPSWRGLTPVQGVVAADLASLRGRVVVLEFVACACEACRYVSPTLDRWYGRYVAQGLVVIAITSDDVGLAAVCAARARVRYAVASDPRGETSAAYAVTSIPAVFLIDRRGVISSLVVGFDASRLAAMEHRLHVLMEAHAATGGP